MSAKIIAVTNQKGGSGKTTVAVHLAGTSIRRGYKTLLIDADVQATAQKWATMGEPDAKYKIRVMSLAAANEKIAGQIKQYAEDYDLIIVDCPPAVESRIPQVMLMIADLALVPIVPNPGDIWAATDLLELAERAQDVNPDLKTRIVASNARPNLSMTKSGLATMKEMKASAPLLKTIICQRAAYVDSMLAGDSAHYFGASAKACIDELESLFNEVAGVLDLPKTKRKSAIPA